MAAVHKAGQAQQWFAVSAQTVDTAMETLDNEETVMRSGGPIHNQRRSRSREGKHRKHTSALSAEDYPANQLPLQVLEADLGSTVGNGVGTMCFCSQDKQTEKEYDL